MKKEFGISSKKSDKSSKTLPKYKVTGEKPLKETRELRTNERILKEKENKKNKQKKTSTDGLAWSRTPAFQAGYSGSNPDRCTFSKYYFSSNHCYTN